jgi:hypothetical protein
MNGGGSRSIAGFSCFRERRYDCGTPEAHCVQHSLQGRVAKYIFAALGRGQKAKEK